MKGLVAKTVRVLAPNDLRLIRRDPWLLLLLIVMPLTALILRWLVPFVGDLVAEWVELERYYGLIVAGVVVGNQPVFLGAIIGLLFIEEREEGTLLALQASPISLRIFLGYRLLVAMGLSLVLTSIGVPLVGLVSVSLPQLLTAAALAALAVPLVGLVYAIYIPNRVQALIALRPVQFWGGLPVLLYFAPTPWQWVGSVPGPLYYPMRLFWGAAEGRAEWWLLLPGVLVQGAALLWLLRRFERSVWA